MKLGVRAWPGNGPSIPDFIAGPETRDLRPDCADDARSIPADDFPFDAISGRRAAADLVVDRVDRDGLYFDQNVTPFRCRLRQLDVDQRVSSSSFQILLDEIAEGFLTGTAR
jgi:hypothetical protein